jgi:hypothetical protein
MHRADPKARGALSCQSSTIIRAQSARPIERRLQIGKVRNGPVADDDREIRKLLSLFLRKGIG